MGVGLQKLNVMKCPYCQQVGTSHVLDTTTDSSGNVRRRRECSHCNNRYSTLERVITSTPRLIKSSGHREDFDRSKLLKSLQIACVKRPVSADDLEKLVDRVEYNISHMGQLEIQSKVVGDFVLEGLKNLDTIAYIRFSIVYLKLDSLESIKSEIEKLVQKQ